MTESYNVKNLLDNDLCIFFRVLATPANHRDPSDFKSKTGEEAAKIKRINIP